MGNIRNLDQLIYALRKGYSIEKGADKTAPYFYAIPKQKKEERHFCLSLAEKTVSVVSQYDEVYQLCKGYLCESEPDIEVAVCEADIAYEREETKDQKTVYKNSYLETLAVYRKISEAMLEYDTFLMHGAVVANGQDAYMFTAKSGTGKTTHINLWLDHLHEAYIVNGDKPLIRITEEDAIACGTPWSGKEKLGTNTMVPLRAIVIMERAEVNRMYEISFDEAFAFLLQQTYQPSGIDKMKKTLQLLLKMKDRVRFYRFYFNNMKEDAFDVSYNILTGGKV